MVQVHVWVEGGEPVGGAVGTLPAPVHTRAHPSPFLSKPEWASPSQGWRLGPWLLASTKSLGGRGLTEPREPGTRELCARAGNGGGAYGGGGDRASGGGAVGHLSSPGSRVWSCLLGG